MKLITTQHPQVGYRVNLQVLEDAFRYEFGFCDSSDIMTAVAAHLWSIVNRDQAFSDKRQWTAANVKEAIAICRRRLDRMEESLAPFEN